MKTAEQIANEEALFQYYGREGFWLMNGRQDAMNNAPAYNLMPPDDIYQADYDDGYRMGLYWRAQLLRDSL